MEAKLSCRQATAGCIMTPMPPSPFLNPAACDAAAGTAAAACTSPGCAAVGPSAADLWARGEALLAEIYAYLAAPAVTARYSEATAGPPCCYNCGYREACDDDCPNAALEVESWQKLPRLDRFDLDAERFMAELDEAPLFLRSA